MIVVGGGLALALFLFVVGIQAFIQNLSEMREELVAKQTEVQQSGPLLANLRVLEQQMSYLEQSELVAPPLQEGLRPHIEKLAQEASIANPVISNSRAGAGTDRKFNGLHPIVELRVTFTAADLGPLLDFLQLIEQSDQPLYITNLAIQRVGNSLSCELDLLGIKNQTA